MSFNAIKFCIDYNIPYRTEGKNCAPGWTQVRCPFCIGGDQGFHGGINTGTDEGYTNCWKCGYHSLVDTIRELVYTNYSETVEIIRVYSNKNQEKIKRPKTKVETLKFPVGTTDLQESHKKYLRKRNFNPDKLERIFGLKGTGHLGDYKFRIIAPIYLENNLISYQGRDITGKALLRYKACSKENEVIYHKHSLYGIDLITNGCALIVEGVTDVWRLGTGAICPFGIEYTKEQVLLIARKCKTVFILFDNEEGAQEKAQKLAWELSCLGVSAFVVTGISTDPGALSEKEAESIIKELL